MRSLVLAICGLTWCVSISAQDRQRSEEAVKPLVVMLDVRIAGSDDYGAGIIAGVASNRLYIATANHVVRKDGKEAEFIKVAFSWLPGETRAARLLSTYDEALDLAVILVDQAATLSLPTLPFNQVSMASSLKKGDLVFPMGYPNRQPWSTRALPDAIASTQDGLRFDTNYLVPGNSGGALLTSAWRIAGLVTERTGAQGTAIPIERVMDKLRGWNYQVQWTPGAGGSLPVSPPSSPPMTSGGPPPAANLAAGRYEVRLLEIQPAGAFAGGGRSPGASIGAAVGRRAGGASSGASSAITGQLSFLDLQMVVNRIPLYRTQRMTLPIRPAAGEGVAEVVIQKGETLQLNLRAATNVPREGRHSPPHSTEQTLGEGSRVAVNISFPEGDGDFILYLAVTRK